MRDATILKKVLRELAAEHGYSSDVTEAVVGLAEKVYHIGYTEGYMEATIIKESLRVSEVETH